MQATLLRVFLVTSFLSACGSGGPAARVQASVTPQGRWLQGRWLQGTSLWGRPLRGLRYDGVKLGGVAVQGVALQGTALSGQLDPGDGSGPRALSGAGFVGATVVGEDDSGAAVTHVIDSVAADPGDPSGQTLLYGVRAYDAASGSYDVVCEPDPVGDARALPLAGVWAADGSHSDSAEYFTLGCTSGVLAKCVRWGYRPWQAASGVGLGPVHQACTRMARADYCGDGTPHTEDGTLIDIYDPLGIQVKVPGDGMLFEAAWTPGGAYCVSKARWNILGATLLLECPAKISVAGLSDILNQDSCAMKLSAGPRSGALVSNRSYLLQLGL